MRIRKAKTRAVVRNEKEVAFLPAQIPERPSKSKSKLSQMLQPTGIFPIPESFKKHMRSVPRASTQLCITLSMIPF